MQAQTRIRVGGCGGDHDGEEEEGSNGYVEIDPTGRYGRYDAVLGKGAMKTVYRAFDELNGTEVAWNQAKVCDVLRSPDALQRMYSEVHLLSALNHESVIRFHASWVDVSKRTFNFITELFTSGTLREYRQKYQRVNIRAVRDWSRQILHGLVYLHSHDPPVIHRDLKCDNIFVNGHLGQVKIGDLGLAAVLRGSQSAHSVIGTPEFMAPELYEEEYNELVDIYSFGMCILEMLTAEYPYSECSNPAQIYKKVTSGKLPDAFYRIKEPEARRFIGRCLENVAKRPSAKELLCDPFLVADDHRIPFPQSTLRHNDVKLDHRQHKHVLDLCDRRKTTKRTDMTITGKMNEEDDTIFLKVQIADKDGHARNIYFPFDILSDTPIDVANEMVKELEITDQEPEEIAEVIGQEITTLVPEWNGAATAEDQNDDHNMRSYVDEVEEGSSHSFCCMSSPNSSYQGSVFGANQYQGSFGQHGKTYREADWMGDDLFTDDDDESSSMQSGKYSSINYCSGNEHDNSDRLCPQESRGADAMSLIPKLNRQCSFAVPSESSSKPYRHKRPVDNRRLMRNRSFVDLRSQFLHRTLVEELSRRHFKTIGAVENIGFQMPSGSCSHKGSSSTSSSQTEWGKR